MAAAGKKRTPVYQTSPKGDSFFAYFAKKRKDDHDSGKW